jgi:cell division septum initiation protein DivIVA
MSMKQSLQKIQKDLESAQAEIAKLYDLLDNVEKTVGGGKSKSMAGAKKEAKPKVGAKGTATDRVLALIEKNPEGISTDAIIKQTGLERKTIYGILNKAKKQKKLKSPKRGTYIAA